MNRICASLFALSLLAACTAGGLAPAESAPPPADTPASWTPPSEATRVLDPAGLQRLLANKGTTLQWIDWSLRGSVHARMEGDTLRLTGTQNQADGPGKLFFDGAVTEVGTGYFTFDGTIRITDTPDRGRACEADKLWHFAITQNRPYYRLREFEWCDGLTDYVDIYF